MNGNIDKYKRHIKRTSNYIKFYNPYLEATNEAIKPYISSRSNRIIDKSLRTSKKVSEIFDIITE